MRKLALTLILAAIFGGLIFGEPTIGTQVLAQEGVIDLDPATESTEATEEADATQEGALATISAELTQRIQERQDQDLTETTGERRSQLAIYVEENPPGPLAWHNFLRHAIRDAILKGLPANIVVLLILFPVITSVIASSRHLIGLKGFGVYAPAVLSVAFASTGITIGLIMFLIVLAAALAFRSLTKRLRLQYLPRTAMLLWGVSLMVLLLMVVSTIYGFSFFLAISIFPLLIIMLLTENFMETQLISSQSQAFRLTLETVFIAIVGSLIISSSALQRAVILNPEVTILGVAIINILVGKYSGLRFLEYFRFESVLER